MRTKAEIYKAVLFAVVLFAVSLRDGNLCAVNTFTTLNIQSGTAVTMGDAKAIIPVIITNNAASTDYIGYLKLSLDTAIYCAILPIGAVISNPPASIRRQVTWSVQQ